jgi:hypothetical protein
VVHASECTESCDASYPDGEIIKFCGTDLVTYETHYKAVGKHCYFNCGISAYYQGSCGCPNGCFADFKRGQCVTSTTGTSQCQCEEGWGGEDCSLPAKGHTCSLHGSLSTSASSPTGYLCQCDRGFTGSDCSTAVFGLGAAPWGEIFDDGKQYHGDKYGDDHPLFNVSNLASIHLTVSEEDYLSQLYPWNCYNASYVPASFYFDSNTGPSAERIRQSFDKVGLRIKGAWSRMDLKKGFNVKFDKYSKGQVFFDVAKIGLKPGADDDDTFVKNMLYTNFQRAAEVPVQRGSYVTLYLNGRYQGLYFMHEDVDPAFIQSRYKGDQGSGNLFKMTHDVNLRYYGDDVVTYQTTYSYYPNGVAYNSYELASSTTNDWTDLVEFLSFVNKSSDAQFADEVESRIDVPMLLKGLVVESFMLGGDGFIKGQNYYFYHSDVKETPNQWSVFNDDFDQEFYFNGIGMPSDDPNIFTYVSKSVGNSDYNPLVSRLLAINKYRNLYVSYYQTFLEKTFGSTSAQQPTERFMALYSFVLPWVAQDKLWAISEGVDFQHFMLCAQNTTANLSYRYRDTWKQIQDYLRP